MFVSASFWPRTRFSSLCIVSIAVNTFPKIIMLSSFGRAAIKRIGAGSSVVSTNRAYQSVWHLQRVNTSDTSGEAPLHTQLALSLRRSYATTTKTTRVSTTKAKKPVAAKAGTSKKAAPRKIVKKPVAKKTKKKIAAKPKRNTTPKTKAKKTLTTEQKKKAEIRALKTTALEPPASKPSSVWQVLLNETAREASFAVFVKTAATKYKSLSPEELEVRIQFRAPDLFTNVMISSNLPIKRAKTSWQTTLPSKSGQRVTPRSKFVLRTMLAYS